MAVVILTVLALILSFPVRAAEQDVQDVVCDQTYALCTSAPCIPDPKAPETQALCQCAVQEGKSYGNKSCEARQPKVLPHRVKSLVSNYSFAEYGTKKTMVCPGGKPWTFCLDSPCIQDPQDPKKALCTCFVRRSDAFVTLGGLCDLNTCDTGYWSGATLADVERASKILAKELGLSSSPKNLCVEGSPNIPSQR